MGDVVSERSKKAQAKQERSKQHCDMQQRRKMVTQNPLSRRKTLALYEYKSIYFEALTRWGYLYAFLRAIFTERYLT